MRSELWQRAPGEHGRACKYCRMPQHPAYQGCCCSEKHGTLCYTVVCEQCAGQIELIAEAVVRGLARMRDDR